MTNYAGPASPDKLDRNRKITRRLDGKLLAVACAAIDGNPRSFRRDARFQAALPATGRTRRGTAGNRSRRPSAAGADERSQDRPGPPVYPLRPGLADDLAKPGASPLTPTFAGGRRHLAAPGPAAPGKRASSLGVYPRGAAVSCLAPAASPSRHRWDWEPGSVNGEGRFRISRPTRNPRCPMKRRGGVQTAPSHGGAAQNRTTDRPTQLPHLFQFPLNAKLTPVFLEMPANHPGGHLLFAGVADSGLISGGDLDLITPDRSGSCRTALRKSYCLRRCVLAVHGLVASGPNARDLLGGGPWSAWALLQPGVHLFSLCAALLEPDGLSPRALTPSAIVSKSSKVRADRRGSPRMRQGN